MPHCFDLMEICDRHDGAKAFRAVYATPHGRGRIAFGWAKTGHRAHLTGMLS